MSTSLFGAPEEHVGDEQIVPDPQELEDRERRERRDDSGMISRQKIVKWSAPSILADSMIDDGQRADVVPRR